MLMHIHLFLLFLPFVTVGDAIQCYSFSNYQHEGNLYHTDRTQIECQGDYCMTISEEGSDFNVYNGTCPDNTITITNCQIKGAVCQREKVGDVYIKVCCCDIELCNSSPSSFNLIMLFTPVFPIFYVI